MTTPPPDSLDLTHPAGSTTGSGSTPSVLAAPSSGLHGRFIPGQMFGRRYRIVALLGVGGMGEVYRADDLELGQAVALKLLPPQFAGDPLMLSRLRAEVRISRQVSHPNVCRVYDLGQVDDAYFLSMEYVDGEDLASVLRRMGRPSRDKALQIAREIAAGLSAAHDAGVLHRDLKPANVLIDGRGRARLTDFGLAHVIGDALGADGRVGTPAYMAPEQLATGAATVQSDIYALGLVLHELFTGRRFHEAATLADLLRAHAAGPPTSLHDFDDPIDPRVERVVLSCLARDPAQRPGSARAVAVALPGADTLSALLAAGETPSPEVVAAAGGRRGLKPVAAAGLLAAVLAGMLLAAALNERAALYRLAPIAKSPPVLTDRARTLLASVGAAPPVDYAFGFDVDNERVKDICARTGPGDRWTDARTARAPVHVFWYRESIAHLLTTRTDGRVTATTPPRAAPGSAYVELDGDGQLRYLEVAPPVGAAPAGQAASADVAALMAASGLALDDYQAAPALASPPIFVERRAALAPRRASAGPRVEFGESGGRVVFWRVGDAGAAPPPSPALRPQTLQQLTSRAVGPVLNALALVTAVWFARVQLRAGRGDRRGAMRLGFFAFGMTALFRIGVDYIPDPIESWELFVRAMGVPVFLAMWWALGYLAFEPLVRRYWPTLLITWTRLLSGQWRDAQVARDALVGAALGVAWVLVEQIGIIVPAAMGGPMPPPMQTFESTLLGGRHAIAVFFLPSFLGWPLFVVFLLMVMLFVTRSRAAAALLTWAVLTVIDAPINVFVGMNQWNAWGILSDAVLIALLVATVVRIGVLALIVAAFFSFRLTAYPITLDLSAWYAGTSATVLAVMTLISLALFRGAVRADAD